VSHPAGRPPGFPNCGTCQYAFGGAAAICIGCALATVPQLTGTRCPVCAQEIDATGCRNRICQQRSRGFGTVSAISVDSAPLDEKLRLFKYDGRWAWGGIFGRLVLGWLNQHAPQTSRYTHILANPSFTQRQPYQHIEMVLQYALTEDVHRRWPIYPAGLVKHVDTPKSAAGNYAAKQMAANAHAAAIQVTVPLAGARVLLVDDLFTTGLQFDAVGRKLRTLGAIEVDGLVLARRPWSPR